MGKKADSMFPCRSIPFTKEGLDRYDEIFGKKDKDEDEHEDIIPDSEESGDE